MESKNKIRIVKSITLSFCDRNVTPGYATNIERKTLQLDDLDQEIKDRLWMEDGKIVPYRTFMGSTPGTGVLVVQHQDTYDDEPMLLGLSTTDSVETLKKEMYADSTKGIPVKLHSIKRFGQANSVPEDAEYVVIRTDFKDEKEPVIECHPWNRRSAVFKDPKHGSATIAFTEESSQLYASIEPYFFMSDKKYKNFFMGNSFNYLNTKPGVAFMFDDCMYEHSPAMGMGRGGGGSGGGGPVKISKLDGKKLLDEMKKVEQDKIEMQKIKAHDEKTLAALFEKTKAKMCGS